MSLTLEIQLPKEAAVDPRLRRALSDPRALNKAAAAGALPLVHQQFVKNARRNRNPFGARGGFWNRMLAGTTAVADAQRATIRMPREVALRYFGGTVRPKQAKLLAIPARKEAYGKSPRQFNDLRLIVMDAGRSGRPAVALVQNDQTQLARFKSGKRKGQINQAKSKTIGGGVFFWLVPMATIKADKSLLPTKEEMVEGSINGVRTYFAVQTGRAGRS